jgi:3-deoxy-manno-octulosonate cytidylyltransferase (CMP-KDO synthetase)
MTAASHVSGTDRCAEAASGTRQPFVLNVQGDEPFVSTEALRQLMQTMMIRADADMGTLVASSHDPALAADPNAVKAVRAHTGFGLYFSRAALPYERTPHQGGNLPRQFWHHLGVYAFRRQRLEEFVALGPSPLELTEKLEQLRALEAGWRIWLEPTTHVARGIDTPQDLEAARARFRS